MILLKITEEIQNNVKNVKRSKEKRNNAGGDLNHNCVFSISFISSLQQLGNHPPSLGMLR